MTLEKASFFLSKALQIDGKISKTATLNKNYSYKVQIQQLTITDNGKRSSK